MNIHLKKAYHYFRSLIIIKGGNLKISINNSQPKKDKVFNLLFNPIIEISFKLKEEMQKSFFPAGLFEKSIERIITFFKGRQAIKQDFFQSRNEI